MSYARIRLDNVLHGKVVYKRSQKVKRCKNCGSDIDYSMHPCCIAKRKSRASK